VNPAPSNLAFPSPNPAYSQSPGTFVLQPVEPRAGYGQNTLLCSASTQQGELAHRVTFQLLIRVEVLPGRIDVAVPHQLLHGNDIASAFEESRRIGMAKFMQRGIRDLRCIGDLFQASQQVSLAIPRLRGKDQYPLPRQLPQEFGELARDGNHPLLVILRRES